MDERKRLLSGFCWSFPDCTPEEGLRRLSAYSFDGIELWQAMPCALWGPRCLAVPYDGDGWGWQHPGGRCCRWRGEQTGRWRGCRRDGGGGEGIEFDYADHRTRGGWRNVQLHTDPVGLARDGEQLDASCGKRGGPGGPGAVVPIGAIAGEGNLDGAGSGDPFIPPGENELLRCVTGGDLGKKIAGVGC